jgi:hypothetical protein
VGDDRRPSVVLGTPRTLAVFSALLRTAAIHLDGFWLILSRMARRPARHEARLAPRAQLPQREVVGDAGIIPTAAAPAFRPSIAPS